MPTDRRGALGGDRSRRGVLLKLGGGAAIVAGGATSLLSSDSFSLVDAGRDASLLTSDGGNATLGIEGYADAGTVPTFTNNGSSSMDITLDSVEDVEFDVGDDGSWELVPVTFTLGAGASVDVAIRDGGNTGTESDIDISATFTDGNIQATRTFAIPAAGNVKEIDPTVTATGNSGKYEFELENKGSATVTLTEIGVVKTTNASVTKVGGKNNDDIFNNVTAGTSIVNNVITVGGSREPLTTNVDLDPGPSNSIKFEFDRFRDSQNKNGDMDGDDVRIEVAFSDGSTATLDLCAGGTCSFASTPTPTPTPGGTMTPTPTPGPPTIDSLTVTKTGSQNRKFTIDSDGSDPDNNLDRVEIAAVRTGNNKTDYSNTLTVSGGSYSISDTTSKLANKKEYRIDVTVYDTNGNSDTQSVTKTTG